MRRIDFNRVPVPVEAGDGLPQGRQSQRCGVGQRPSVHELAHRVTHCRGRPEVRLTQTEFDHRVACGFQFGGSLAESHGVERLGQQRPLSEFHSDHLSPRGY